MDEKFLAQNSLEIGVNLSEKQVSDFEKYYQMIIEKNKVMNLTAISDERDFVIKHFVDSLSVLRFLPEKRSIKVIDIGTGAGFPGIPIKIAREDLDVVLFDSLKKRLVFLDEVIDGIGLRNVRTVHGRAEDFGRKDGFRGNFDVVVSRAVANLKVLLEFCVPFLRQDGIFIAMKGQSYEEELLLSEKFIGEIGCEMVRKEEFVLPCSDYSRSILVFRKVKPTPDKYPRSFPEIKNS
jgi:16S rRNA (guanine527-N7)-methyltransferase